MVLVYIVIMWVVVCHFHVKTAGLGLYRAREFRNSRMNRFWGVAVATPGSCSPVRVYFRFAVKVDLGSKLTDPIGCGGLHVGAHLVHLTNQVLQSVVR